MTTTLEDRSHVPQSLENTPLYIPRPTRCPPCKSFIPLDIQIGLWLPLAEYFGCSKGSSFGCERQDCKHSSAMYRYFQRLAVRWDSSFSEYIVPPCCYFSQRVLRISPVREKHSGAYCCKVYHTIDGVMSQLFTDWAYLEVYPASTGMYMCVCVPL